MSRTKTKPLKKITEKVILDAVKACADHYMRTKLKTGRGFPDCLVRHNQYMFFIEVKAPGDKASKLQKSFMNNFQNTLVLSIEGGKVRVRGQALTFFHPTIASLHKEIKAHLIKRGYLAA